jgi:hypothetical protein
MCFRQDWDFHSDENRFTTTLRLRSGTEDTKESTKDTKEEERSMQRRKGEKEERKGNQVIG